MSDLETVPSAYPDVPVTPPLTQTQRVIYTYTGPSKTFADILRSRSWWLPFVLSLIFGYAYIFSMGARIGWDNITASALKQNPAQAEKMANLPPDQRQGAMRVAKMFTQGITLMIPVFGLLFAAVAALILWGTINFGFGGKATFGEVFAVWMFATLPLILRSVLGIITLFTGLDADSFNLQNPIGSNIGYYLSPETPKWLISLGTSLDVFWIWSFILVGIGLAIVAKVKRSSGLTAVFGWWILILLIKVGIAAATS